ncbi:hypothetical protein ACFRMQ_20630 [Kitasatospora sp. NPDC056783]|uniref:hypothetical protein n=1 Tax=Kitasatospora sp. NPDC056783 TaxID=3345943 RepID=UPI003688A1D2
MSDGINRNPVDDGQEEWLGLGLAEAAAGARIGPAPVADIVAGGHRLRRRRRSVVGAVALAAVVALAGGTVAQLRPGPAPAQRIGPAQVGAVPSPTAASATSAAPAVRDPLTPVRTLLNEGLTADGKQWQVWHELWPLAPKERAFEQATAVRAERGRYDASVAMVTEEYVRQYWQPDSDVVDVYFTVDGVRIGHDYEGTRPAPGKVDPRSRTEFNGGLIGRSSKDGIVPPVDLVLIELGPDVGRVAVTWEDGTTTEPRVVTVADSPIREMAVARPGTMRAKSWQFYDKDGNRLQDSDAKYLTESPY